MPSVTPDPQHIRAFATESAFEHWLAKHFDSERELYLRLYKKGSDSPSISYAQALDVALCWGWIDGLKKAYDSASFLQRFTPRTKKSVWSKRNCAHIERLIAAGRMTPHGLMHVSAAKADGRWDAAYAGSAAMEMPPDLLRAISEEPLARATYDTLDAANRYALAHRLHHLKTEAGRTKRIASFVQMLKAGHSVHPMKASPKPPKATGAR